MFTLPSAKSVRRSELDSPGSSRASSPDNGASQAAQAKLAAYFSEAYSHNEPDTRNVNSGEGRDETVTMAATEDDQDDGAYAFRLFARPSGATGNVNTEATKIVVRSPSPLNKESGIVVPRSKEYYLARSWTAEHQKAAQQIMCTPESIFAEAAKTWKGCELPWRVKTVRLSRKQASTLSSEQPQLEGIIEGEAPRSKNKPNKKRRMVIRQQARAKVEKAEQRKVDAAEREAAEREKRTKRNREKKVKKRQRDKAKKEAEAGEVGEASEEKKKADEASDDT